MPDYIPVIILALVVLVCAVWGYRGLIAWKADVKRVREGGFCPPPPGAFGITLIKTFAFLLGFAEVGPIKVLGKHRIPVRGTIVLVPLHVDPGDIAFVSKALDFAPFWYMIRTTEMYGWRGWMGARTGALAICEETDIGRSAGFKASLEAIARKDGPRITVVFGQGELIQSEQIIREGFKEGFYALARLGSKKLKEPVYVIPMALHYKRDPRLQTIFQKITFLMGFQHFRNLFGYRNFGGVAVIGRPFVVDGSGQTPVGDPRLLPRDSKLALDLFVERIRLLQKVALKTAGENSATVDAITGRTKNKEERPVVIP